MVPMVLKTIFLKKYGAPPPNCKSAAPPTPNKCTKCIYWGGGTAAPMHSYSKCTGLHSVHAFSVSPYLCVAQCEYI